jgi:hypothetical protein
MSRLASNNESEFRRIKFCLMSTTSTGAVDRFAAEAACFREWARDGTDRGELAVRNALIRIASLYLAALELPPEWSDELADLPDAAGIPDEERQSVYRAAERLPFTTYAQVLDPLTIPPKEPVIGSLADDIADIYADVVGGLREYEADRKAQALWEWGFNLRSHWGQHATDAISALHHWLADNAWSQFSPTT